jgi:hypothetical protein
MANVWMTNDPEQLIGSEYVKKAKYYSFKSGYFYQDMPESITKYEHSGLEVVPETIKDSNQIRKVLQLECLYHDNRDVSIHRNYLVRVLTGPDRNVLDGEKITKYLELVDLTVDDLRGHDKLDKDTTSTTVKSYTIIDSSTGNMVATGNVDEGNFHKITPDISSPVIVAESMDGDKVILQRGTSMFSKENMSLVDILPLDAGSIIWEGLNIMVCESSATFKVLGDATDIATDITKKYKRFSNVLGVVGIGLAIAKPIIDIAQEKDNNKRLIIGSLGAASLIFSIAVSTTPWGMIGKVIGTFIGDVVFNSLNKFTMYTYDKIQENQATVRREYDSKE